MSGDDIFATRRKEIFERSKEFLSDFMLVD
jgi:hypothetical protein